MVLDKKPRGAFVCTIGWTIIPFRFRTLPRRFNLFPEQMTFQAHWNARMSLAHQKLSQQEYAGAGSFSEYQFEAIYRELKQLAYSRLRSLPAGQTLHATVLVHEVYLRLIASDSGEDRFVWTNRRAFFAAASEAMRHIAIDHYRRRKSLKRGGHCTQIELDWGSLPDLEPTLDLVAFTEIIDAFELVYPEKAELVKLRYFVGMTMPECACAMEISLSTAERYWRFSRAWLAEKLEQHS